MAMSMASGGGGRRRHSGRKSMMAEINVTPMVDVMLVLLIIFMVAAPLMTTSIDIQLPTARGGTNATSNAQPLQITLKRTGGNCNSVGQLAINDASMDLADLPARLKAIGDTRSEADRTVFVSIDKDVCYGDVMDVLGEAKAAGFKASMVVLPKQGP